jgi:hypothetical protein
MRRRTRVVGIQPRLIKVSIGDTVSIFKLTNRCDLYNRTAVLRKVRELNKIASVLFEARGESKLQSTEHKDNDHSGYEFPNDPNVWPNADDYTDVDDTDLLYDFPDKYPDFI